MKSPPRDELNPIRGLLGTPDDFPPVTDNRKTVRPVGRPLIILMYASLTPASSAKDTWCHLPSEGLGGGLYAHVYERQPSLPPSPGAGGTRPNLTNSSLSDGRPLGEEARGWGRAAVAIYHNGTRGGISARLHTPPPAFAAGASGRQKVTGEKRDCRQAAKQDAQNAAGEGKINVRVTVKNCCPKAQKTFLWQRQLIQRGDHNLSH